MPRGRPATGVGHYLRDVVYGATDGTITTLAVVAGATGASFPARVGLVLGLANLVADGVSMAASNYLGIKSELEQSGQSVAAEQPWRHAAATFGAFVCAGALPLLAYLFTTTAAARLSAALALALATLALVGA
jgi:VIT1/CCC1 family predicted Fe2+/Mn2+ transporter